MPTYRPALPARSAAMVGAAALTTTQGWMFKATGDRYMVGDPALKMGVDAEHAVKVRQLPDAEQLVFKTVEIETYGDGEVSRWIELPQDDEEPEQHAPVLKLQAAASAATPLSPSPTGTPSRPAGEQAAGEDAGMSAELVVGAFVAVVVLVGGGTWWLARRRASAGVK